MNALTIYIWGIADQVHSNIGFMAFISGIFFPIAIALYLALKSEDMGDEILRPMKWLSCLIGFVFFASLAISTLTPNSKTIAAMVIIPELANSDAVKRDLPEIYDMAIKKLKNELSPTTPEKQ